MRGSRNPEEKEPSPGLLTRARELTGMKRAIRLVWESAPGWTIANATIIVIQGLLPLVSLYFLKLIIDAVTAAVAGGAGGEALGPVLIPVVLLCCASLATVVFRSLSLYVSEAQSACTTDHIQTVMHAKSVEVDLAYYENPGFYDTLFRAQAEAPVRPIRIVNGIVQVGQSLITLAMIAVILVLFSWALAVLLVLTMAPVVYARWRYADRMYQWRRRSTSKERQSWYFHWMLTHDSHAKEVRLFNLGPLFTGRYHDLREDLRQESLEISGKRVTADVVSQLFAIAALFVSFAFIVYHALLGMISLGDLVFYFGIIQQSQTLLHSLLSGLVNLYEDSVFLRNLYEFLDIEPGLREPEHPVPVPQPIRTGIRFDHVSFQYPGTGDATLSDLSFTLEPCRTVALVGENGSGKTTLVKLLCRLYDPTTGTITVDGTDLRNFRIIDLRKEISVVFQDYARYNLTARENILLGTDDMTKGDEAVRDAALLSGAHEFIEKMDNRYDTVLGNLFERGVDLSIGEWQKIALARAFIRDAQVVVMDEPTSALDPMAEAAVMEQLRRIAAGKMAVIISHRLSSVKSADDILLLESGRIVERGTHEELILLGGRYKALFETQASQYR